MRFEYMMCGLFPSLNDDLGTHLASNYLDESCLPMYEGKMFGSRCLTFNILATLYESLRRHAFHYSVCCTTGQARKQFLETRRCYN